MCTLVGTSKALSLRDMWSKFYCLFKQNLLNVRYLWQLKIGALLRTSVYSVVFHYPRGYISFDLIYRNLSSIYIKNMM
jgi:hypothetical protein